MSSADMRVPSATGRSTLAEKVDSIKRALGLDAGLDMTRALRKANQLTGLANDGTLMRQADVLLQLLGV